MIDRARADLRSALTELQELARGLHPAVLSQAGLGPALESVAERLPLAVRLEISPRRWGDAAEAAAYFIACEALTNAVKHAHATQAAVTIREEGGCLHLTATDDGVGGADPWAGSGLIGVRDRAAALGGTCTIGSPPGVGVAPATPAGRWCSRPSAAAPYKLPLPPVSAVTDAASPMRVQLTSASTGGRIHRPLSLVAQ
jgi:signal transduction histidine kinase